jgi:hypothetical protein
VGNKKQERAAQRRQADKDRRGVTKKVPETKKNDKHGFGKDGVNHSQTAKGSARYARYRRGDFR